MSLTLPANCQYNKLMGESNVLNRFPRFSKAAHGRLTTFIAAIMK
jgi:hypothetical protein